MVVALDLDAFYADSTQHAAAEAYELVGSQIHAAGLIFNDAFSASKARLDTLRVQVVNNHIRTQNLSYNYYCPNTKYLTIGYLDP